jgi:hypothetical protein
MHENPAIAPIFCTQIGASVHIDRWLIASEAQLTIRFRGVAPRAYGIRDFRWWTGALGRKSLKYSKDMIVSMNWVTADNPTVIGPINSY